MKEKQLFPCDTAKLARMMLREDADKIVYVIQSNYDKAEKAYKNEFAVPVGTPTAELEAWNAYIGALDTEVNKKLRTRPELENYFAKLSKSTICNIGLSISDFVQEFKKQCESFRKAVR